MYWLRASGIRTLLDTFTWCFADTWFAQKPTGIDGWMARSCRPKSPTLRSGLLLGCLEMTHDPYLVASDLVGSGVEVGAKHV